MSLSPDDLRQIRALITEHAEQPIADIRARLTTEQDPEILAGRLRRLRDRVDAIAGTGESTNGSTSSGGGGTVDPADPGEPFTPGDASTPGATVAYESRLRGGTAEVVGFSEFTSPSTPAKKYLTISFSGAMTAYNHSGTTCTGGLLNTQVDTIAANSKCVFNPNTGTVTNTTSVTSVQTPGSTSTYTLAATIIGSNAGMGYVLTATTETRTGSGACVIIGGGSSTYSGITNVVLSGEDTDSAAITRLLAGAGGTFGSWGTVASFPAAAADYDARTTGFTFDYQQTQLRANYTGMPAGWPFKVRVRIARVNATTGAISTVQTLTFNPTADGTGAASWTVDVVPAAPGYTYRVQSVSHFL